MTTILHFPQMVCAPGGMPDTSTMHNFRQQKLWWFCFKNPRPRTTTVTPTVNLLYTRHTALPLIRTNVTWHLKNQLSCFFPHFASSQKKSTLLKNESQPKAVKIDRLKIIKNNYFPNVFFYQTPSFTTHSPRQYFLVICMNANFVGSPVQFMMRCAFWIFC